jgi:predicted RNA-binding protein Jag
MIAPTIEEAIAKGASELGMPEDALDVEFWIRAAKACLALAHGRRVRLAVKSV